MGFLASIWNGLRSFVGLILPVGKGRRQMSTATRWTLHLLLLALVLVGLYFLNAWLRITPIIATNVPLVRALWLPILFLLIYTLAWLGWWLYKLLVAEEEPSYYPDIDEAWDEAVRAMGEAGLRVTELPLFVVLGRPEGPEELKEEPLEKARKAEETFFHQAAGLQLALRQAPASPRAPLHVYATRDAIYVTCCGASLLGEQAAILAGDTRATAGSPLAYGGGSEAVDPFVTMKPGTAPSTAQAMVKIIARGDPGGRAGSAEARRKLRMLERKDQPSLMSSAERVAELSNRLRHLCRLILRDRQPYCPINGIMLLLPLAGTESDDDAKNTREICRRDLYTLRQTLKVQCPVFALVCDVETVPGFRDFIQTRKEKELQRRVGQRFPLATDLNGQLLIEKLESSVEWLCGNVLRDWVYDLFRVETPGRDDPAEVVESNKRLFLLLSDMRDRQQRLGSVLSGGMDAGGQMLFGGCYVAGTGRKESREQAFVPGVLQRLIDSQNFVSWTPDALADDARAHRWATLGYGVLAVVAAVAALLIVWLVFFTGGAKKR